MNGTDKHGRISVEFEGGLAKCKPEELELFGQRPAKLREAESRAMASAMFDFSDSGPKRGKQRKKHRIVARAEHLTEGQLESLVALLESRAMLCTIGGRSYTVSRGNLGWKVRGLDSGDTEHTVLEDLSACSCQDFRFREHRCKHLEAVSRVTSA